MSRRDLIVVDTTALCRRFSNRIVIKDTHRYFPCRNVHSAKQMEAQVTPPLVIFFCPRFQSMACKQKPFIGCLSMCCVNQATACPISSHANTSYWRHKHLMWILFENEYATFEHVDRKYVSTVKWQTFGSFSHRFEDKDDNTYLGVYWML